MPEFNEFLNSVPEEFWQDSSELNATEAQQLALQLQQAHPPRGLALFAKLIQAEMQPHLEAMAQVAARLTAQKHGKVIRFYAPVYISNECTNTCTYCGFTMENKIKRKTLSMDELEHECQHLKDRGFRSLLLVSGEHQRIVSSEFTSQTVKIARQSFDSVSIETAPYRVHEYEEIVAAGADGLTLYQETYDRETYASVHLRGKKKDYDFRLGAPERGAQARFRRLNMGVLLGLAPDWRRDTLTCALHLDWMMKNYWRVQYSISLPRLCPSETDFQPAVEVTDKDFVQIMLAWRIAFPELGINVSTREPAKLRDGILGLGVTQMSAESATEPGGYCNPEEALKQFDITDHRRLEEIISVIKDKGLDVAWKDWESCMLG